MPVVLSVAAVGEQLANGSTSVPLLYNNPAFLSTPVIDLLVRLLCARARAGFPGQHCQWHPSQTDGRDGCQQWGHTLCDYYQDVGWGAPENGVALYLFVKGLLGLRVLPAWWLYDAHGRGACVCASTNSSPCYAFLFALEECVCVRLYRVVPQLMKGAWLLCI